MIGFALNRQTTSWQPAGRSCQGIGAACSLSTGRRSVSLTVAVRGMSPRFDFQVTFHEVRLGLPGNN